VKYRGWEIAASLMMPRSFWIKDISVNNYIEFDKEVPYKPAVRPQNYRPYQYLAAKDDEWLVATDLKKLKKLIREHPTNQMKGK
jgi:hypothetical protein